MKTYTTVEEYLEVVAGIRDIATAKVKPNYFFGFDPIISLARYDVDVLTSMSEASNTGKALTERQGELLCKILLKYQRQLASKGIDVSPIEQPVWRQKLRKMDYSQRLSVRDDKLVLKFPYHTKLIETLRSFRTNSQGSCVFDQEAKEWNIGLTEYNLNWVYSWAKTNGFVIDQEVETLNNLILESELVPHRIELRYGDTEMEITNCPDSLYSYINEHLGGFGHSNLLRLVDAASVLGYTIEDALSTVIIKQWGPRFLRLANCREIQVNPDSRTVTDDLASVLDYAIQTNRLPVVIYEPDLSGKMLEHLKALYPEEDIASIRDSKNYDVSDSVKFIHTFKPLRKLARVPMLVSSAGLIFGGDKQIMVQRAEKIVYIANDVYNATGGSKNQTRKVTKLGS